MALPALGVLAVIAGLGVQGLTDTIFFRPEVQLSGWFCLATLSAADPDERAAATGSAGG
jgi:putative inorganic carbon (HCO3(-)) transporter